MAAFEDIAVVMDLASAAIIVHHAFPIEGSLMLLSSGAFFCRELDSRVERHRAFG